MPDLTFLTTQFNLILDHGAELIQYAIKMAPILNKGLRISLALIIPSAFFGLLVGILAGTARALGGPIIKRVLNAYVALFRGTPLVVQILIAYYGFFPLLSQWARPILKSLGWQKLIIIFNPPAYVVAIIVFTLCSGAYQSEYIRGAIISIGRGQFLAARALGFSDAKTFWSIIVPQALRRALPGCGNEFIYLIKYSSLAYLITVMELTGLSRAEADLSYRHMEIYLMAAFYYLALVSLATWFLRQLEKHYYVPGFAKSGN